jgi:hypothetical protein
MQSGCAVTKGFSNVGAGFRNRTMLLKNSSVGARRFRRGLENVDPAASDRYSASNRVVFSCNVAGTWQAEFLTASDDTGTFQTHGVTGLRASAGWGPCMSP